MFEYRTKDVSHFPLSAPRYNKRDYMDIQSDRPRVNLDDTRVN